MKSYLRAFQQFAWQRNALLMAILLLSSFGLKAQEKPNLWVSEPVVHNTLLAQNEEINLSFKVTNSGGQTAVGNLLRIYLSPDEVFSRWSDKIIYEENVGQLSAGASKVFDGLQVAPSASWESGTWYLFVVADYADFVDESFEGDNISSPVRLLVEDRQISSDKPDLLVSKLELQSDMITPNYAFNVSFNVTNVGTADMDQAVKHIVYLDEITDEGIVSERVSVHDQSFLAQGATQRLTRSFFVGAEKSGGNFRIRVEADAQQRLVEAREDNNSVSAPVAIKKVEQKQADLHFTDVSSLPDYVQAGSSFGFRSYLRNNGNADGTRFHHSYGLSTSPSRDDRIYSTTRGYYHSHLAAGSNYNRYISINVPDDLEEGIYYLVGVMDLEERIDETNEDNNTFSRQIYVKAKPKADLRVNNLSAEKTNLSQGETFRLNLEIENAGEGATGRDYWVFYDLVAEGRSNDGQDISSYDEREQRYSLAASAKDTYAWDVRVPQNLSPGRYKLIIKADAYDQVSEANESNNTRVIDVLVREAEPVKLPNLLLTNTSHNGPTMPGSLLSVNTTLLNNGEGDGDWNTKIKVYLSEDDKPGNDLNISGGGRSFNPMPAGYQQSTNLAVRIPATYSPGNYYIIVRADADKKEDESNEEDNIIVLPLNLMPAKIDLRPEIVSYPAQIGESSDIRVAVRVHNDGESSSSPVRLSYYLSQDKQIDDNDLEWAYAESSDIYAGSSDYISRDIWIGARDLWGTYYLLVKADYQDQIAETDETNNVAVSATTVEVVNSVADFRATAPTFNRSKVAFGETMVPFNYRVYNDGFRNATVNTKTYLSSTTNLNGESVLIYEENHYIAAGGSVTAYREFDVPSYVQAGNYYLLVVLDQNDQVEELDEDNNIIASATTMEVGAEDVFLEAKLHFSEYGQALQSLEDLFIGN